MIFIENKKRLDVLCVVRVPEHIARLLSLLRKPSNLASKICSNYQMLPLVAFIWKYDVFFLTFKATITDRNPIIVIIPAGESEYVTVVVNAAVIVGFSPSLINANNKAVEVYPKLQKSEKRSMWPAEGTTRLFVVDRA